MGDLLDWLPRRSPGGAAKMSPTEKMLREQEREVIKAVGCLAGLVFAGGGALGALLASLLWWLNW